MPPVPPRSMMSRALSSLAAFCAAWMVMMATRYFGLSAGAIDAGIGISSHAGSWLSTSYLAGEPVGVAVGCWLALGFSVRNVLLGAIVLFLAASSLLALMPDFWVSLTARALMGLAAGAIIPLSILTQCAPSAWPGARSRSASMPRPARWPRKSPPRSMSSPSHITAGLPCSGPVLSLASRSAGRQLCPAPRAGPLGTLSPRRHSRPHYPVRRTGIHRGRGKPRQPPALAESPLILTMFALGGLGLALYAFHQRKDLPTSLHQPLFGTPPEFPARPRRHLAVANRRWIVRRPGPGLSHRGPPFRPEQIAPVLTYAFWPQFITYPLCILGLRWRILDARHALCVGLACIALACLFDLPSMQHWTAQNFILGQIFQGIGFPSSCCRSWSFSWGTSHRRKASTPPACSTSRAASPAPSSSPGSRRSPARNPPCTAPPTPSSSPAACCSPAAALL